MMRARSMGEEINDPRKATPQRLHNRRKGSSGVGPARVWALGLHGAHNSAPTMSFAWHEFGTPLLQAL